MKLNNKGYAITIIVFGILIVFIIVLSSLLVTMNNSVKLNNVVKEDIIENIQLGADTTGMSLTERIEQLELQMSNIKKDTINEIYPVGSIYLSMNEEDLSTKFGGEWQLIETGRTLLSAGTTTDELGNTNYYKVGTTGGSSYVTLDISNVPSHSHSIPKLSGTAANSGSGYTLTYNTTGTNNASTGNQSANHTHSIPALSGSTNTAGSHTHSFGSDRFNSQSSYLCAQGTMYGIYARSGRTEVESSGDHSHTVTTASTTGSNSANHTHKYTNRYVTGVSGVASHSHTVTTTASNTGNVGSGSSFSVQDPYIAVYMYKRIN